MARSNNRLFATCAIACAVANLTACTPTYDWREVHGTTLPYIVLLPSKPSTYTRPVSLGKTQVNMTMTASQAAGATFAVATADLPDATQARTAIEVMKNTMVGNISGVIQQEKLSATPTDVVIDVVAGPTNLAQANAMAMHARFIASGQHVYQVMVVGPVKATPTNEVETFLSSFKTGLTQSK